MSIVGADRNRVFLATALATRYERRVALVIAGASLLLFLGIVPFVRVPLAQMPGFIPSYEAALFFIDLLTAVLLFDQCARLGLTSILVLALGYLFDALIIIPHALSFPGAFTPTGLLGAEEQTTAWLYVFWHGGFPLFVIGYVLLRPLEASKLASPLARQPVWTISASIIAVVVLAAALTLLVTWGHDWLPVVMQGSDYSLLVRKGISPLVWVLTVVAMISLWQREQRVVDLWLMLVMWIWLFDIALAAVIGSTRFDLGFYAGRLFGLLAASFLLLTLLIETFQMYAGAIRAAASAEQKLAQLSRSSDRAGSSPLPRESTDMFIRRQNILHYRSLLESGSLDEAQRRSIERLLSEEEGKLESG